MTSHRMYQRWAALGADSPHAVQRWTAVVANVGEAEQWAARSVTLAGVPSWKSVVTGFDELDSWLSVDVRSAAAAREWKATCTSINEVVHWQAYGVEAGDVAHWRQLGVDPAQRRDWGRLAVEDLNAVSAWTSRDFGPGDAKPWLRANISPVDAAAWRDAGFDPATTRRWGRVVPDPAEAAAWRESGLSLRAVRAWRAAGAAPSEAEVWAAAKKRPREAAKWLGLGVRSYTEATEWDGLGWPPDRIKTWTARGFTPQGAQRWTLANLDDEWLCVGDADTAQAWQRAGLTPDDWAQWSRVSPDPETVTRWQSAVGDAAIARRWQQVRMDDPEVVGDLTRAGVGEHELRRWTSLGLEPHTVASWRRRWSIDEALTWVQRTGMDLVEAWGWHQAGMTPETASSWRNAGVGSTDDAVRLRGEGLSPKDVERWRTAGATTTESIAHWASCWTPDDAEHWRALCGDCDLVAAWELGERVAWDDSVLLRWAELGVRGSGEITAAVAATGYQRWTMALELFERFLAEGVAFDESLNFLASVDRRQAAAWIEHGFCTWKDVQPWRDARVRPDAAAAWRGAGVSDPSAAARLERAGINAAEASAWRAVAVAPDDVVMWRSRWPVALAAQWVANTSAPIAEAWAWHEATDGDLSQASVWAGAGIRAPEDARLWRAADVEPREAGAWVASGFTRPEHAAAWRSAGYAPDEAGRWVQVVSSPEDAAVWQTQCNAAPDDVAMWRGSGVDAPARAHQLLRIGLTADTYRDLAGGASPRQLKQRLRRQAVEHAGLRLVEGVPTLDMETLDPAEVVSRITEVVTAASRAREPVLRVHHGAPHLTLEAMHALPDARYVRGGQKATLYQALEDTWFPHVEHADLAEDGATLDLALTPAPDGTEFLVLADGAAP